VNYSSLVNVLHFIRRLPLQESIRHKIYACFVTHLLAITIHFRLGDTESVVNDLFMHLHTVKNCYLPVSNDMYMNTRHLQHFPPLIARCIHYYFFHLWNVYSCFIH